jgi:hypothetical protein
MSDLKLHFALHTSYSTLHTALFPLHTSHFTVHTAKFYNPGWKKSISVAKFGVLLGVLHIHVE